MIAILFLIIIIFIVARTIYVFSRKNKDSNGSSVTSEESSLDLLIRLLKELNCKPEIEKEGDGEEMGIIVTFDFQGGNFRIRMSPKTPFIKLTFLFFFETTLENIDLIRNICNQLNININISKYVYSIDEEINRVHIHIFAGIPLMNEIPDIKMFFESTLANCFELKRAFIHRFDELYVPDKQGTDMEKDRAEWIRELFLLREQEFSHQKNEWKWRLNGSKKLTLKQLVEKVFDLIDIEFLQLKIVTSKLKMIANKEDICNYELLSEIVEKGNDKISFSEEELTLIVLFENCRHKNDKNQKIAINLKAEGQTENTLYVRLTCYNEPLSIDKIFS